MKKKVGIIGYGTIGKHVFEKLSQDEVEFAFVLERMAIADNKNGHLFTDSTEEIVRKCAAGVDLVIETATSQAVIELAPTILKVADMVVFSATAFADQEFLHQIKQICQTSGHNLYIPHGAILGLDGIFDGKDVLQAVSVTTTKRPENLGRTDTCRTILYEGSTRNVCKLYPRNVNVHAAIALAGLGFDKTQSKIISDPDSPGNTHSIEIKAQGCSFKIEVLSEPISGVTGAYTPVSAYSSIRRVLFNQGLVII
ncbi:aspartate dehydrogenase domain-containing protein [Sporomusa termitida]|uniref:L-aspartate dehydrogenase n=1 Tax=Sporomusa termitida TaxID=2377 RepID=A0A517DR27_9FIRM|nr:aspartate dehydrogenase domain-containing protein [Sporomusa termitida]QDR79805.1 L-aspartate dehydrogenase [Sporomusa termitida]